jgi:hypothetical protein
MNILKPGDRLFTGVVVESVAQCEAYNAISRRIASFELAGRPAPQELLNGRHNLFCALAYQGVQP